MSPETRPKAFNILISSYEQLTTQPLSLNTFNLMTLMNAFDCLLLLTLWNFLREITDIISSGMKISGGII